MLQEHGQDPERLRLQSHLSPVFEKFSCAEINFKRPETAGRGEGRVIGHRGPFEWERLYHPKKCQKSAKRFLLLLTKAFPLRPTPRPSHVPLAYSCHHSFSP